MTEEEKRESAVEPRDQHLIPAFQAGDRRAFDRLVLRHQDKIFNLCFRLMGECPGADDCAQHTSVKLYRSLKGFRFEAEFATWLYSVAVNTCRNRLASAEFKARRKMVALEPAEDGERATGAIDLAAPSPSPLAQQRPSVPTNEKNIRPAIELIDRERGGGGSELLPALKKAFGLPRSDGFSRTLITATDGYVAVEKETFEFIHAHLGDCNFFAFGIGSSVNRYLVEGMARAGMGGSFVVSRAEDAAADKFRTYVQSPILSKVKVAFTEFDAFEVEPLAIPDVFADRPVVVRGQWRGETKGTISLGGISGNGEYQQQIKVKEKDAAFDNGGLKHLWGRSRIARLDDDSCLDAGKEIAVQPIALGLKYHLLPAYTSFVASDEQVRLRDGKPTTVKQPLPLPEGVSNHALGEAAAGPPVAALSVQRAAKGEFLEDGPHRRRSLTHQQTT